MQLSKSEINKEICKALALVVKELKADKRKSILAYESDLPRSVVHYILNGVKDPQLTTFWRLALGLNIKPSELLRMLEEKIDSSFLDL
ncbi:MAG: hypothetical protein LBJ74_02575 [Heliobacteriaceae bacterium]|jgi:hypothetical protein|nr:hypothetical protein [Heliobacteriaceae bacterium]